MLPPPINPGDTLLDKYRVERVLGQGGMGFVVAARHVDLEELFAIKLMLAGSIDDEEAERRFLREARAAVRLKGEHSVRVHDVGRREDGALYMVMEHLVGTDLKSHLGDRGPLPVEEAVSYVLQACEGIGEAHDLGIVHRDIKPANLFLTKRRNGTACIKVLDFGISKQISTNQSHDLTRSGAVLGSPLYMSPEQMIHAREVDCRTDLWSMGVVLYELLTGKVPFEGETFTQVVYRVTNVAPKPLRAVRPDLPAEVEDVVMRCLEKDPSKRFESADALAAALRPLLGLPASTQSLALADTVDRTTGAPLPRPRPSAPSGAHGSTQPGVAEGTTGPSTTAMSTARDRMSVSQMQGSGSASSWRTGKGKLALGMIGAGAIATLTLIALSGRSVDDRTQADPGAAPAAAAPAPSTPTNAPAVAPAPAEAPSAPEKSANAVPPPASAPAPSPAPAATTKPNARTAKPVQPVPTRGSKSEIPAPPAPPPSPPPAPPGSAQPRKHSMY